MSSTHPQTLRRPRPGPWSPAPGPSQAPPPLPPSLSWPKRTGFKATVSSESNSIFNSRQIPQLDLESGCSQALPTPPAAAAGAANGEQENRVATEENKVVKRQNDSDGPDVGPRKPDPTAAVPRWRREEEVVKEEVFGMMKLHIDYELRDVPGVVPIVFYGFQHYLTMIGS